MIDDTIYLVQCKHPRGSYFAERDINDCDLRTTLRWIIEGQFDGIERVVCLSMVDHTGGDCSEDIATKVACIARLEGQRLTSDVLAFIECHIGTAALHAYRLEAA